MKNSEDVLKIKKLKELLIAYVIDAPSDVDDIINDKIEREKLFAGIEISGGTGSNYVYDGSPINIPKPIGDFYSDGRNTSARNGVAPNYIVIHYTAGATSKPGSARNTVNVWKTRKASADFIVDDGEVVQYNPDIKNRYTWAVGDKKQHTKGGTLNGICRNRNSISIEICSNLRKGFSPALPNHEGWYFTEASLSRARDLCRKLMREYNISKSNICRHYDVTGKPCPGIVGWNADTGSENDWIAFKNSI